MFYLIRITKKALLLEIKKDLDICTLDNKVVGNAPKAKAYIE